MLLYRPIHRSPRRTSWAIGLLSGLAVLNLAGCDGRWLPSWAGDGAPRSSLAAGADEIGPDRVVAQGVLQPRGGVLAVMAMPGDRVVRVAVREGDAVKPGDLLIELESRRAKEIELDVARTQLNEGRDRMRAEQDAANAKLQVAKTQLEQAKSQLRQSRNKLAIAEGEGGSLDLMRRAAELGQRKLDRLQSATDDPSTTRLVSDNRLEEESLKISETRAQYETAHSEANDAIAAGTIAIEMAKQEINAAEMTIVAARASGAIGALEKKIQLLDLNLETARLTSPTAGRVLAVKAMPGQATTTMPLLHLADTSNMICVAEINVADLNRIRPGQTAKITGPGLAVPLSGTVERIHQMIAPPALPNPFPMASVDRFTAEVTIAISDEFTEIAANRIALQVEVVIQTDGNSDSAKVATSDSTADSAADSAATTPVP